MVSPSPQMKVVPPEEIDSRFLETLKSVNWADFLKPRNLLKENYQTCIEAGTESFQALTLAALHFSEKLVPVNEGNNSEVIKLVNEVRDNIEKITGIKPEMPVLISAEPSLNMSPFDAMYIPEGVPTMYIPDRYIEGIKSKEPLAIKQAKAAIAHEFSHQIHESRDIDNKAKIDPDTIAAMRETHEKIGAMLADEERRNTMFEHPPSSSDISTASRDEAKSKAIGQYERLAEVEADMLAALVTGERGVMGLILGDSFSNIDDRDQVGKTENGQRHPAIWYRNRATHNPSDLLGAYNKMGNAINRLAETAQNQRVGKTI